MQREPGGSKVNKAVGATTAKVRVTERRELGTVFREAHLSREEELVLRLRHGVPEPRTATLEFRGQGHPEIAAKLAMMELAALEELQTRGAVPAESPREAAVKQAIIERLKKL
jgi:hypothetical protein